MRRRLLGGSLLAFLIAVGNTAAQEPEATFGHCATFARDSLRTVRSPEWAAKRRRLEALVQSYLVESKNSRRGADEVIRIPVVVHVVHDQAETSIGGLNNPNISDEQIRSQIEVLNEDYRRIAGTAGHNTHPRGADAKIQFYLAEFDPDGHASSGITRHRYTEKTSFNPFSDDLLLATIVNWPTDKYMNVWTCRLSSSYLGISQFPSTDGVDGLDTANDPNVLTDGVIIDFRYFGRKQGAITSRVYNLGRTTTHEVGHWLGLIHTWGDAVCGTDYCEDTPPTEGPNRTTVCEPKFSNCNGVRTRNMIENYMDYSPDSCMNLFTQDQVARMQAVLALSPRRARMVEYAKESRLAPSDNLLVEVYPNPVSTEGTLHVNVRFSDFQTFTYRIYDINGREVDQAEFKNVYSRRLVLDVQLLPPGIYIFRVDTDRESTTQRFVVN